MIALLLRNCNFTAVMNRNVKMQPLGGLDPQVESRCPNQSDRELALFSQGKKKGYPFLFLPT